VLMSDVLKGQVPDLDDDVIDEQRNLRVIVIGEMIIGSSRSAITGILRGVLFDVDPEIEIRVDLSEAMGLIQASQLSFGGFELHHGTKIINMPGPFLVKAARLDEISPETQLCTLGLHLKKQQRYDT